MRWLLLSDLHIGRADEAQELAPNTFVSSSAAECVLGTGISRDDLLLPEKSRILQRAIDRWKPARRPALLGSRAVAVNKHTIHDLVGSSNIAEIVMGARLMPLSDFDTKTAYDVTMGLLTQAKDHSVMRACLDSLCAIEGALDLVTLAQTDYICHLAASPYRDVRVGAVKALGLLSNDEQVVSALIDYCGLTDPRREPAGR